MTVTRRSPSRSYGGFPLRASTRRFGGSVADQMLSSLTNFGLGVVVARTVGPTEYGAFSLAFATYLVVLGVSRSLNTDPLMVRYSAVSAERWREGTTGAVVGAAWIGVAAGVLTVALGSAAGGSTGIAMIAMGITMPGLMLQDAWRMAYFSAGRPSGAVINDLIWVLAMAAAFGALFATGNETLFGLTLAWGGAAVVAAFAGFLQTKILPTRWNALSWWRAHRDLGPRFLAEFASAGALTQLSFYTIGFAAGLEAVGAVRAALLVLGPLLVLLQGGTAFGVAESARVLQRSPAALLRASRMLSIAIGCAALVWGTIALLLPEHLGQRLLGASWDAGRAVLVPMVVYMVAAGLAIGANTGFRALAAARTSLRTRVLTGSTVLVAATVGAALGGARGAAWAMACAHLLGTGFRWFVYRRLVMRRAMSPSPPLSAADAT